MVATGNHCFGHIAVRRSFLGSRGKRRLAGTVPKQGERLRNSGARLSTSPDRAEDFGLAPTRSVSLPAGGELRWCCSWHSKRWRKTRERAAGQGLSPILHHLEPTALSPIGSVRASRVMKTNDDGIVDTAGAANKRNTSACDLGSNGNARTTKLPACLAHRGGSNALAGRTTKGARSPSTLVACQSCPRVSRT